jgi:hypothetical protein
MGETYLSAVIGYLSWPVMILISYGLVWFTLKYFEKKIAKKTESDQ